MYRCSEWVKISLSLFHFLSLCERHSENGALIWCCFWSSSASHCFRCRVFPNSLGFVSTSVQFKVSRCLLERGLNSCEILVMFLLGCVMWFLIHSVSFGSECIAFECWNIHGCIAVRRVLIIKMYFCQFPCVFWSSHEEECEGLCVCMCMYTCAYVIVSVCVCFVKESTSVLRM